MFFFSNGMPFMGMVDCPACSMFPLAFKWVNLEVLEIARAVLKYSLNGNLQYSQLRLLRLLFRNLFLYLFLFVEGW